MNEDEVYKETVGNLYVREYIHPTVLTDAKQDDGLFGIRIYRSSPTRPFPSHITQDIMAVMNAASA